MANAHGELEQALAFYRAETSAANRAFFQGKIDALYANAELTDKQRLDRLAPYFGLSRWGSPADGGYASHITSPRELLLTPDQPGYVDLGIDNDGTVDAAPEPVRLAYLEELHSLLQQMGSEAPFESPVEFAHLLSMVDAIADMDFRQSGSPTLNGTCWPLGRMSMSDRSPGLRGWYDDGWHVVRGWRCGYGTPVGSMYILYAHRHNGTSEEQELKWRVNVWEGDIDAADAWFSSIAEYLRYRCQWLSRLPNGWQQNPARRPEDDEGDEEEVEEETEEG